jgi:hypothetical protein
VLESLRPVSTSSSEVALAAARSPGLTRIPVQALPGVGQGFLGDELELHLETSLARLLRQVPAAPPDGVLLALGGIDFDAAPAREFELALHLPTPPLHGTDSRGGAARFEGLLQSRFEVLAVGELYDALRGREGRVLTGDEATKSGLFEFAPQTLCGLALAGANRGVDELGRVPGIVTAEELTALDLSACDLAVLSACETGIGIRRAGQGIQSPQSALHTAGARTAITSLWKVDDAATQRLF